MVALGLALAAAAASGVVYTGLPGWAAAALLHPLRTPVTSTPPIPFESLTVVSDGLTLRGWKFPTTASPRGTIVYLHGIADNRQSAIGVARRFGPLGYEVLAFDSRGHGESDGDICTYGYHERRDLRALVAAHTSGPVIAIGTSLGAAIALQTAPDEPRLAAVVAVESFSDLRTVAAERAPFFIWPGAVRRAFAVAEARGRFEAGAVSPASAASRIRVPVLLVHGAADRETPADHSRRIFDALRGPRRLILVPDAGHNQSLTGPVWREIESWIQNHPHGSAAESVRRPVPDCGPGHPDQRLVRAGDEHEQPPGACRGPRA